MHSTVLGTRTSSLSGSSCDQRCLVLQFFGFLHFEDQKKPRNIGALFPSGANIVPKSTIWFLFVVIYSIYSAKILSSIKFHQTFQGFFRDFVLFPPQTWTALQGNPVVMLTGTTKLLNSHSSFQKLLHPSSQRTLNIQDQGACLSVICGATLATVIAERSHSPQMAALLETITGLYAEDGLVLLSQFNRRPVRCIICGGSCRWDHMLFRDSWLSQCRFHLKFLFAPPSRGIAD